ncbi:MAG TPA: mannonate dehydratase, partial [Bryobacteraceae bacterium]|nr:mannonate dehydratase [Bryobacteraceae bacterium]
QGVTSISPSMDAAGDTVMNTRNSGPGAKAAPAEWDLEKMKRWKDACDQAGMRWEGIRMDSSYIWLKPGPERERKLDAIVGNIRKAGQVGVKLISHHWTMIPIRRNRSTPGRGGSTYKGFKLEENWRDLPVAVNGRVSADDYWERISAFLHRVIPVCEEVDVRMAAHPYDPPGLPPGYQGTDNWDAAPQTVLESLRKYEAVVDSPYNGFQLCLGTCAEGCRDPRREVPEIVRYFAPRGKIHQIHMRNIRGGLHDFDEVYIDEGDVDYLEVVRILRDAGWAGAYLPDHNPAHPDDPGKYQAFAMAFGYINSLIRSANLEVPA